MINCICVDKDKENRTLIERMIRKINGLRLVRSYAALDKAAINCKVNNTNILFISLYDFPVQKNDMILLREVMDYGTKIIVMSSRIGVVSDAIAINVSDCIMFPTSSRRLWKGAKKALTLNDYGIEMATGKTEYTDTRISLTD